VDAPRGLGVEWLAELLRHWDLVETVEFDALVVLLQFGAFVNCVAAHQDHLKPAPLGVDALFAWTIPGGRGQGQRLVDVEQGWTVSHQDLVGHNASLLFGSVLNSSRAHGTAVLGAVCATGAVHAFGVAPDVATVAVSSYAPSHSNIPDALTAALTTTLKKGGVLLLEAESATPSGGPIELLDFCFDAVKLVTDSLVTVVEVAGNGKLDLAMVTNAAGKHVLDPAHVDFRDSGAIIVGSAMSTLPHRRDNSSFGRRVDCYAWGDHVETTSSNPAGATNIYDCNFNGTSSAGPIVAGAAVTVQGIVAAAGGAGLTPQHLRTVLNDPATGTASKDPANDRIGVMPNLRKIIENTLDIHRAQLYVRDNPADVGLPHHGPLATSPDVILTGARVADYQGAFGEGSSTEGLLTAGPKLRPGKDRFIYVRARNRGSLDAEPATVTAYWAPAATFVAPNLWTRIGSASLPAVPRGDLLTVADAIVWRTGDQPADGAYSLIAVVGHNEPGDLTRLADFDTFRAFIRSGNVAWRSVNRITGDATKRRALRFRAVGALDRAAAMGIDVIPRLPDGAELALDAPPCLLEPAFVGKQVAADLRRVRLRSSGCQRFGPMVFSQGYDQELRLHLAVPKAHRRRGYQVTVRQFLADTDEELGRVSWQRPPG
jgi:hypothetical protein